MSWPIETKQLFIHSEKIITTKSAVARRLFFFRYSADTPVQKKDTLQPQLFDKKEIDLELKMVVETVFRRTAIRVP